jgi:hypothetical protein
MLGIECVRSTHGDIRLAAAGIGRPISRINVRSDRHIPPPAESPIRMISMGEMGATPSGG